MQDLLTRWFFMSIWIQTNWDKYGGMADTSCQECRLFGEYPTVLSSETKSPPGTDQSLTSLKNPPPPLPERLEAGGGGSGKGQP